jgi:DNA segregation ATPase FtsK/SpoIIIE-like protein
MKKNNGFDQEMINALKSLRDVPERTPECIEKARTAYLSEVKNIAAPVSAIKNNRHKEWIANLLPRKENYKMSTLGTILLVLTLIVGGSGLTAVSAQASLPDSALYPVKILTEEIQFGLTINPEAKWQLSLARTEQRMQELRTMISNGLVPSEAVMLRLNTQMEQTIRLAAGLAGSQAGMALTQTQTRLETQERLMLQIQTSNTECEAIKARIQQMIQLRVRQIQSGIQDPLKLQQQIQQQLQIQQQTQQQVQDPNQYQSGTQAGDPNLYKTPQMPLGTQTPMPCHGNGLCGYGN